jgi:hypothetical protein
VADERQGRTLADRLFHWGRRDAEDASGEVSAGPEKPLPTKVLPKFLAALAHQDAPALLDLGPVVGPNVSFFGERLGCRILIEDLYADVDRFAREDRVAGLAEHFSTRLQQADTSVDGILCWDLFSYLDKPSSQALGKQLARILKPGGVLTGMFATSAGTERVFTRFVISDDHTLVHRPYRSARARGFVINNRDISLLFPGMRVAESFLMLTHTREILFRKASSS